MQSVHGYFSQYGVYQVVGFEKTKIKDSALEKKVGHQFEHYIEKFNVLDTSAYAVNLKIF